MITIVMAGEPHGKGRPRFSRASGTVYTPEKTARYEERLAWAAQSVMAGRPLLEGALCVTLLVYVSIPKSKPKKWKVDALAGRIRPTTKPDLDNIFKGVADALNKVVWIDDSQIAEATIIKDYSDQPRIEVHISAVDNLLRT